MPISRGVDKKAVVHLHNGILPRHGKEGYYPAILIFCDCTNGPGEYYVNWNKPVRERQIPCDFTYTLNSTVIKI